MNESELRGNPAFQNLSPEKLQFLASFLGQQKSNNANEMMTLLMAFSNRARGQGIQFSREERDFIIEHLKTNMSLQERQKTDLILRMMK